MKSFYDFFFLCIILRFFFKRLHFKKWVLVIKKEKDIAKYSEKQHTA